MGGTNAWHRTVIREYDQELIQLVSVPSRDEFPTLDTAVEAYFFEATRLIDHTNEVVLQHLNSPDPVNE